MNYLLATDKKKYLKRKAEARRIIKAIAKIMDAPYNTSDPAYDLWMILTALRGPDSANMMVKPYSTARIRAAIGIKPGRSNAAGITSSDSKPVSLPFILPVEAGAGDEPAHFISHYGMAVNALLSLGILKEKKK